MGSWKFLFLAIFCFAITFPWMTCMAEENIGSLFLKGNATAEPWRTWNIDSNQKSHEVAPPSFPLLLAVAAWMASVLLTYLHQFWEKYLRSWNLKKAKAPRWSSRSTRVLCSKISMLLPGSQVFFAYIFASILRNISEVLNLKKAKAPRWSSRSTRFLCSKISMLLPGSQVFCLHICINSEKNIWGFELK